MDEVTQRRLLGAGALLAGVFLLTLLLPDPAEVPDSDERVEEVGESPNQPPQIVVYDLRAPLPSTTATGAAPAAIVPTTPQPQLEIAPVADDQPKGVSLGWQVQLGSYATAAGAQGALAAMQTVGGYTGVVQSTLKGKKRYFRARIGPFASMHEARDAQQASITQGYADARILETWKPQ